MSKRIAAPVLLLIAAACSIAAVFAVQRIESSGGPLSEPSVVPPFFSPDGDGVQDVVEVNFTTMRPERVTLRIVDADGALVRELLDDARIEGSHTQPWDGLDEQGRAVPEGTYRALLRRAGDARTYEPTERIVVDVTPPPGRLDASTLERGQLRGLVLLPEDAVLVVEDAEGTRLRGVRSHQPRPESDSARPQGRQPAGTFPYRFTVPAVGIDAAQLRLYAQDLAGNRRDLLAEPGAARILVAP